MSATTTLSLDLGKAQELVNLGARRAAGFIALGTRRPDEPLPNALALDRNFPMRWFPRPLPAESAAGVRDEFNAWLAGSGLFEVEKYFSAFLNELWHVTRAAGYRGGVIPGDFTRDRAYDADQDVEEKFRRLCTLISMEKPAARRLDSLSRARKALMHAAGVVRATDATGGNRLTIAWLEPQTVAVHAGAERKIDLRGGEQPPENHALRSGPVDRDASFAVGDRIALDAWDLSSMIYTYQVLADQLVKRMAGFLEQSGVFVNRG